MTALDRPVPTTDAATGAAADGAAQLRRVTEATDASVMGPRLRSAIGAAGRAACHVLDAKYEPGVRATVLYEVGGRLVRGDLVDDPDDGRKAITDRSRPAVDPGVLLSCFPDDADLPALTRVVDPAFLRAALREALPGGRSVLRCRVDLLRYRPGKRATLAVAARGPAERRARRLVVKSYHDGRKAAAVAAEAALLVATSDPAAPLRFAPVRAHLPDLSVVVQGRVDGVSLHDLLVRAGPATEGALRRAAVALAALHRQPGVSDRMRSVDRELRRFLARGHAVAQVAPGAGGALVGLAVRLGEAAPDVPAGVLGLVHGDCKPSQFLLRGDREVVLLDLDSCGLADPAGDVGTFLATLRQHIVRDVLARRTTPSAARARQASAEAFLGAYLEAVEGASDVDLRRRISWYEAVALERKALRCFARAPASPLTRALVDEGHRCLDRLGGTR